MQGLIEIAISLIFVFLIVSLIVTAINEIVSGLFRLRPKMLWRGIEAIIDDKSLRERFYQNGILVNAKRAAAGEPVPPSDKDHPSYIAPRNFAKALTMVLGLKQADDGAAPVINLQQVRATVADLPQSRIRDVLISAISDAEAQLEKFEASLEAWYQSAMDRLSGEFKRHNQRMSMLFGLLIAVGMNVDAIGIAARLNQDDTLRQAVVAEAVGFADDAGSLGSCAPAPPPPATDTAAADGSAPAGGDDSAAVLASIECYIATLGPLLDQLPEAAIGWPDPAYEQAGGEVPWTFWLLKLVGWIATACAVTLGAPFWFDLLKRFVNIRSSGVKPPPASGAAAGA